MTEYFTKDVVIELLKNEKPNSTPHERLTKILEIMNRGVMINASDLRYIHSRQVREKPDCEFITSNGGCKIGVEPKCPAVDGWKRGLIGCAAYSAPPPSTKLNRNPLEPVIPD